MITLLLTLYKLIATKLANIRRKSMAHHERQAAPINMLHRVNNTPIAHSLMSSCSSHDLVSDWVASSLLSEEM